MREILFLAHRIPYPPDKGDKIRSWHFLSHLVEHCKVHLGCFVDDADDLVEHAPVLRDLCGESYFARMRPSVARARSLCSQQRDAKGKRARARVFTHNDWGKSLSSLVPLLRGEAIASDETSPRTTS